MYICSFLSANTNTFEKNKKIQTRVKILPKNVFESIKQIFFKYFSNTLNLYIYYKVS